MLELFMLIREPFHEGDAQKFMAQSLLHEYILKPKQKKMIRGAGPDKK
jgi:hypothetical protein